MNLEPMIQSEVSQKEKDRYCILSHIYRIQKNGTEQFIYRATVEKQTYKIDLRTWERGGEAEMYAESNMETYITICKIDSQWEFAVWLRKVKQGHCTNLEGQDGQEDGRQLQRGGVICIPMADSCSGLAENNKIV